MRRQGEVLTLLDRSRVEVRPLVDCDGLVALHAGQPVGAARYRTFDNHRAELQLAIAEGWERRGVGATLLDLLAEEAALEGVSTFVADTSAEDSLVLAVLTRWSPDCTVTNESGVYHCEMPVDRDAVLHAVGI